LLDPRWIIQDDPHPPRTACSTDASGALAQRSQRITRSASTARFDARAGGVEVPEPGSGLGCGGDDGGLGWLAE
jgi:hypothetical protein